LSLNIYTFKKFALFAILYAPWYIRNNDLYRDLLVEFVNSEIQRFSQKHEERLHHHENIEAIQLLDNMYIVRRLQREKTI
jgi:hypothetical protein